MKKTCVYVGTGEGTSAEDERRFRFFSVVEPSLRSHVRAVPQGSASRKKGPNTLQTLIILNVLLVIYRILGIRIL